MSEKEKIENVHTKSQNQTFVANKPISKPTLQQNDFSKRNDSKTPPKHCVQKPQSKNFGKNQHTRNHVPNQHSRFS